MVKINAGIGNNPTEIVHLLIDKRAFGRLAFKASFNEQLYNYSNNIDYLLRNIGLDKYIVQIYKYSDKDQNTMQAFYKALEDYWGVA